MRGFIDMYSLQCSESCRHRTESINIQIGRFKIVLDCVQVVVIEFRFSKFFCCAFIFYYAFDYQFHVLKYIKKIFKISVHYIFNIK